MLDSSRCRFALALRPAFLRSSFGLTLSFLLFPSSQRLCVTVSIIVREIVTMFFVVVGVQCLASEDRNERMASIPFWSVRG